MGSRVKSWPQRLPPLLAPFFAAANTSANGHKKRSWSPVAPSLFGDLATGCIGIYRLFG
jgi:hypothetical protein